MERFLGRVAMWLAALVAAAGFVVIATVYLSEALYFFLLREALSRPLAALVTGLAALAGAALAVGLAAVWSRKPDPPAPARRALPVGEDRLAEELGKLLGKDITDLAKAHPVAAVIAGLAAGVAVGGSETLREVLRGVIER